MALSANSVFEVQTGGNDTNGGGFVTGAAGTDYSLVAAKRTATGSNDSTTDAVAVGTGVITSVTAAFTSAIVGNIIYLQGGTGVLAAGWYQVITFTSATSITVDRNVAAGTGITMNIGGALASPGMAGGVGLVSGNIIYIKAGTYTIASATINIATGCFSSSLTILQLQGYQTTRGDLGTAPLLQASGISTFTVITSTGGSSSIININIDGASLTSSRAFVCRAIVYQCSVMNCTNSAFNESISTLFSKCTATGCSTVSPFLSGNFLNCIAYDNTIAGFTLASRNVNRCISDSNSGATSDGFIISGSDPISIINCVAYNNGRDGFRNGNSNGVMLNNCIGESNAGFGINNQSNVDVILLNNATYNNTSGGISLGAGKANLNIGAVAGSGSFFIDAPNQNFALNNTAGGGASARAAGYPGVLPIGGTGFLDIGTLQHADPASSGGMNIFAGEGIGSVITG